MSDHRLNPRAIAKAQGKQMVQLSDLGDGVGFAGFELRPVGVAPGPCDCGTAAIGIPTEHDGGRAECPQNAPPTMAAVLFAIGGPHSPLSLNVELRAVPLGEIGCVPIADLKRMLSAPIAGPPASETPPQ